MYFIKTPYEKEVKNISIYQAKSIVDECDYVSSEISKLMRQGVNPSDITVICRDLDKYQRELQFSLLNEAISVIRATKTNKTKYENKYKHFQKLYPMLKEGI